MDVIIPLAGKGTRLRPHTYSKPKPLIPVAGKAVLGHILDKLKGLPVRQIAFITGDMEEQIVDYVARNYKYQTKYIKQKELLGDGHAVSLADGNIEGDALVIFVDTIFIKDIMKDIKDIGSDDGIVWVKETDDPRRFGIVTVKGNRITDIEEKPENPKSNLAIIGLYYFRDSKILFRYLQKVIENKITSKKEYRLADAMMLMLKDGMKLKAEPVKEWLDCGKPETLLTTNKFLLDNGFSHIPKGMKPEASNPVNIDDTASVQDSVIGPYVSVGEKSIIKNSKIANSILGRGCIIENSEIHDSLIGDKAVVRGVSGTLNMGDDSEILS